MLGNVVKSKLRYNYLKLANINEIAIKKPDRKLLHYTLSSQLSPILIKSSSSSNALDSRYLHKRYIGNKFSFVLKILLSY